MPAGTRRMRGGAGRMTLGSVRRQMRKRTAADAALKRTAASSAWATSSCSTTAWARPPTTSFCSSATTCPRTCCSFDVGCLTHGARRPTCATATSSLTVDAVDGTGAQPGTVFRFPPDAMARRSRPAGVAARPQAGGPLRRRVASGLRVQRGCCLGMQVENMSPAEYTVGLTPKVFAALPLLVETVAAELDRRGFPLSPKKGAAHNSASSDA